MSIRPFDYASLSLDYSRKAHPSKSRGRLEHQERMTANHHLKMFPCGNREQLFSYMIERESQTFRFGLTEHFTSDDSGFRLLGTSGCATDGAAWRRGR